MKKINMAMAVMIAAVLLLGGAPAWAKTKSKVVVKERSSKVVKSSSTPRGWSHGNKTGWHGESRPPGQMKKIESDVDHVTVVHDIDVDEPDTIIIDD